MVVVRVNSEGSGAVLGLCVLMGVKDKGKLQVLIAVKIQRGLLEGPVCTEGRGHRVCVCLWGPRQAVDTVFLWELVECDDCVLTGQCGVRWWVSFGMKIFKFYYILMFKCLCSQGPTQGPPAGSVA